MKVSTCVIIGASKDRKRYSNKAVRAYIDAGYTVYPVTKQGGTIEGLKAYKRLANVPRGDIDVIALYVRPEIGVTMLSDIANRHPKTVFAPQGAISQKLKQAALSSRLSLTEGCSITAAGYHPDDYQDNT